MTVETIGDFVQADFADRSREADELLKEVIRGGRTVLLTSERAWLSREMGWDEKQITKELRRVNNIMRLQAIAGTPDDREAALDECQTSVDLLAKEGPKIEQKIQELQSKLNGLERDASTAQKRVEAQSQAVQQLRQYCPQDIVERVKLAVATVDASIGKELRNAEARLLELRSILNIGNVYESPIDHLTRGLKFILPAAVSSMVDDGAMIRLSYSPAWPQLKSDCESEYSELSQRLPELRHEYENAIQTAEAPLDFHADPRNIDND
ncbi:MAG: hypothetical protein JNL58_31445 [Planctomyces sp.]|nr:hypothetical protein [Planctomyces sp.]